MGENSLVLMDLATAVARLQKLTKSNSVEEALATAKKWKRKLKKARRKLKALKAASAAGVGPTAKQEKLPKKLGKDERELVGEISAQLGVTQTQFAKAMKTDRNVDPASPDALESAIATMTKEPPEAKS